jgi:polysaccharide deacetylase 2 family uncharacterized protein YibQ
MRYAGLLTVTFLGLLITLTPLWARDAVVAAEGKPVYIALIIDDMGNRKEAGEQALGLPGNITYAFLPGTPHAWEQAIWAHKLNREVMLHLPMESELGKPLGMGALTQDMTRDQFLDMLKRDLASVPFVSGVNNHMGSLLTRDAKAMRWLMEGLREADLFFIDSRTTDATVAEYVAREQLVATARRHVFLDHVKDRDVVKQQLALLIATARHKGRAIGIGHPYPETLSVLAQALPRLKAEGIELVPASALTNPGRIKWHASSSPLPKAVKNSKPLPSPIF